MTGPPPDRADEPDADGPRHGGTPGGADDAGRAGGFCPYCGAGVLPGDLFCEQCGRELSSARCARCGPAPVDPDGYCERCGLKQPTGRDHAETTAGGAAGVSDRGLRHARNEDAMVLAAAGPAGGPARGGLTVGVVCDGVSSSPRADEASSAAASTGAAVLLEALGAGTGPEAATRAAAARAAAAVAALASSPDDAPACTYVSAVVGPGGVTVGWVGDSRAYWLRSGPPGPGSRDVPGSPDRSVPTRPVPPAGAAVPEDRLPLTGSALLTEDDTAAPGVLSAWLGADAGEVEARVRTFAPRDSGAVVVCSDGLWGYLREAAALAPFTAGTAPLEAARALVRHALAAGGRDNVTVLVIPFDPPPAPAGTHLRRRND
ncbi:serine/threonine phosphatase [Planomonospora sphaerica]|uniref:Serine/threonine phosphatase n=1 Tax=Planomonospora sphaerica TaxID=161355 RepID=A0A171B571_9ACTN|nr:protein phosphatase 2C domain-containing protein [Planomonospora sphaerica]GAT64668.1 serine/threonine phosphatase [Planomonospora sphaerica]